MTTRKELSELYQWIRKNNQHTPDEVINFMYEAAKEKLKELELVEYPIPTPNVGDPPKTC